MASSIPCTALNSTHEMPVIAFGSAAYPPASPTVVRLAILDAVAAGYRHFDTASFYGTEEALGKALAEAVSLGLVKSRHEFFITSKLWMTDCQQERVVPALQESLRLLQQEYVDLYLIHWPVSLINDRPIIDFNKENLRALDIESVWKAMEECVGLGLTKSIGVSNFSCKKLEQLLQTAVIPPAVNQVEMNPVWQQKKLIEFCKLQKGIKVVAYSPLGANGAPWGSTRVMDCDVLKKIAEKKGKSLAQVCLRWIYEQGAGLVCKSFNKGRMMENASIFDWELSEEELEEISGIPQYRGCSGEFIISENGPFRSVEDLWDDEV